MNTLLCNGEALPLSKPVIMGILNVTPDSFSDGGQYACVDAAVERAAEMVEQGAGIIDVGGESTRPGAEAVTVDAELERVIPVVESMVAHVDALISVDTSKPEVMKAAISAGCHIVNDVNALQAEGALDVVASSSVAVVLMHMQGKPRTMQKAPRYNNVVLDVGRFLAESVQRCRSAGIEQTRIVLDPGFGFGKSLSHNIEIFNGLNILRNLGYPLLVGVSRKSMIGSILGAPVEERLLGSITLAALAAQSGPCILRVHDVAETAQVAALLTALQAGADGCVIDDLMKKR